MIGRFDAELGAWCQERGVRLYEEIRDHLDHAFNLLGS